LHQAGSIEVKAVAAPEAAGETAGRKKEEADFCE